MLVWATDISFDQHKTRSLCEVSGRKCANVIATKCVSDQNIGSLDMCIMQRAVQLGTDSHACAGHRARVTEPRAGAIIAARSRPLGHLWLHDGTRGLAGDLPTPTT
jgi:hypothetical protein